MQVYINSDKNITADSRLISFVRGKANHALDRFKDRLTRVEIHLSDVNSHKFGTADKRCMIEARPAGRQPVAVTMLAANVKSAISGSLSKLQSALDKYFARSRKGSPTIRRTPAPDLAAPDAAQPKKAATPESKRAGQVKSAVQAKAKSKTATDSREPKKAAIYQARRKSWPARRTSAATS